MQCGCVCLSLAPARITWKVTRPGSADTTSLASQTSERERESSHVKRGKVSRAKHLLLNWGSRIDQTAFWQQQPDATRADAPAEIYIHSSKIRRTYQLPPHRKNRPDELDCHLQPQIMIIWGPFQDFVTPFEKQGKRRKTKRLKASHHTHTQPASQPGQGTASQDKAAFRFTQAVFFTYIWNLGSEKK